MPVFNVSCPALDSHSKWPVEASDEDAARLAYRAMAAGLKCGDKAICVEEVPLASSGYEAAQSAIRRWESENRIAELLQVKPQTPTERTRWASELLREVRAGNAERYHRKIARMADDILHDIDTPEPPPPRSGDTRNDCIRRLQSIFGVISPAKAGGRQAKGNPGGNIRDRRPDGRNTTDSDSGAFTKLVGALNTHHEWGNGACGKTEPVGVRVLAGLAKVSPSRATDFFNAKFNNGESDGHARYKYQCGDKDKINQALRLLNGEVTPAVLNGSLGREPEGPGDPIDE